jgi:prophage antirepressor-like protein
MNLQTFDFNEAPVRVMLRDEQPWVVAADVCRVLELTNPSMACEALDEDENITLSNPEGNPRAGIPHQLRLVSESGLYALVFKSRKPEARKFRKWVTAEVLPALRQTGRYEMVDTVKVSRLRAVSDDMAALCELLLTSARSVHAKTLDVGRAQQVANLAARFLETVKMEGDAIGYEKVFELPAGEGSGGVLQAGERHAAEPLQELPQRGVPFTQAVESGLPRAATSGQETLGAAESATGEDAPAEMPGTADLGPATTGGAEPLPGSGGGAVGAA